MGDDEQAGTAVRTGHGLGYPHDRGEPCLPAHPPGSLTPSTHQLDKPALCRGPGQQGVRFGFNFNKDKTRYWVTIHPGDSGLTHQQVLDRLLGRVS
jgi:hypothetical protein